MGFPVLIVRGTTTFDDCWIFLPSSVGMKSVFTDVTQDLNVHWLGPSLASQEQDRGEEEGEEHAGSVSGTG